MPLKSMAKSGDGLGFNSVLVCNWADGSTSASECLTNCEGVSVF